MRILSKGLIRSLNILKNELVTLTRHRRGIHKARAYQSRSGLKLNLGCGNKIKPDWINIDIAKSADIILDLREPFPFKDRSCVIIYTEHFLEHLSYPDDAIFFLKECFRLLDMGGELHIGVPDTEWPLYEYCGIISQGYFDNAKTYWHPKWCKTKIEHINYHFRQDGEHMFAYDKETLENLLHDLGFSFVERRSFDITLDSEERKEGTLYVVAKR